MNNNNNFQLHVNKVTFDGETGSIVVSGFELESLIAEFYHGDVLDALDYSDVMQYVSEKERERREEDE